MNNLHTFIAQLDLLQQNQTGRMQALSTVLAALVRSADPSESLARRVRDALDGAHASWKDSGIATRAELEGLATMSLEILAALTAQPPGSPH